MRKKAFLTSLVWAGVIYALLVARILSKHGNDPFLMGSELFPCSVAGLATGIWAALSNKPWRWYRHALTVFGFWFLLSILGGLPGV